jgi:hypothetical protein
MKAYDIFNQPEVKNLLWTLYKMNTSLSITVYRNLVYDLLDQSTDLASPYKNTT